MPSPDLPPHDRIIVRDLIARHAAERPGRRFASFADGTVWSYGELRPLVESWAGGLAALGVAQGDHVLSWLPNGPAAVRLFLALNALGAIYVPINIAYRGEVLAHVIANSGARLMIADGRLIERLGPVETAALRTVLVLGGARPALPGLELVGAEALEGAAPPAPPRRIEPWDTQQVIYTSGTTGPSKGVMCSYYQGWSFVQALAHIGPDDCNLISLPMFHVGGTLGVYGALVHGGSVAVIAGFETASFWDTVRRHGVTTTGLLGVMLQFLMREPPSPADRDHPLRTALVAPLDAGAAAFAERFGVELHSIYNMTELSVVLYWGPNPTKHGARPRTGLEARIVDEHDIEVAPGTVGELVLRSDRPWAFNSGYLNDPAATAAAWRNGWFHTGDAFRQDADGDFHFVDRIKDAVRRRGENISSFEVERAIAGHPDVREVAVVGVRDPLNEEEVLAAIAPVPGRTLDPAALLAFLAERIAPFMIPRYVRLLDALPRTPTQKVLKAEIRAEGVTPDTWDRAAAGIAIRRERLDGR